MARSALKLPALAVLAILALGARSAQADGLTIRGYNESRWRMRQAGQVDDQDVFDTVYVSGRSRSVGFELHGAVTHDLEGLAPAGEYEDFAGLTDTYNDRTHGYVYTAAVDYGGDLAMGRPLLRIGRQWRTQAETIQFDGATLRIGLGRFVEGTAIAGQPVHVYERTPKGDRVTGWGVRVRPFHLLELGADYLRMTDAINGSTIDPRKDELAEASAVVRLGERLVLRGATSWIDGNPRRTSVRGFFDLPELGFSVTGTAIEQTAVLEDLVTEISPLQPVLGVFRPYRSVQLAVRQGFGEGVALEAEVYGRDLETLDDESAYNRAFRRYRAGVVFSELPLGLELNVHAENWQTHGAAGDDARTGGFQLSRKASSGWSTAIGSEFSLFKYDQLTFQEKQDVRTWFARVERKSAKGWGLRLSYEIEDADAGLVVETVQVVDVALRRSF